jgi:hypothetical protein
VIKADETMAEEQGIKTLKIMGRSKIPIYPADWIAGVDYNKQNEQNNNKQNDNDNNDGEYRVQDPKYDYDNKLDYEEAYDQISQNEIDDLMAGPGQEDDNANPTNREQQQQQPNDEPADKVEPHAPEIAVTDDEDDATVETTSSRPSRQRS